MNTHAGFADLVERVRAGDNTAAARLVELYEPQVRRVIRLRLTDSALRQVVDSMDISQSVLGNFFVRAAMGQFELDTPERLVGLLAAMARNKVTNAARKHRAGRRDVRRNLTDDIGGMPIAGSDESPSSLVSQQELLRLVRSRLSKEEREIAELRASGAGWTEVAEKHGGTAESQRKRFARALDRVAGEIGLDEPFE